MKGFLLFPALFIGVFCQQRYFGSRPDQVEQASITEDRVLDEEISGFIRDILSDWGSPGGASVVVVRKTGSDGWIVETQGYGNADLAGKTPITSDSLFSIGSNSKLFAAIATGLLISNETLTPRITWRTKLASVIPEWKLIDPIAHQESTILDALSHRTGLPRHELAYDNDDSLETVFERLQNLKPSASFRDIQQYNNMMYSVLSSLPTKLLPSRIPYSRYVKEHIFDRLNMVDTTYSYGKAQATGKLVEGLAREGVNSSHPFAPGITRVTPFWAPGGGEDGNFMSAAGGIISNGKDMAVWLQTLLLDGVHPLTNETVIPKAVLDMVTTGHSITLGRSLYPELSPAVYGGGQNRFSYRGYEVIEHNGYDTGYHSEVMRIPSKGLGVAVLLNDDMYGMYMEKAISFRIVDKVLGLEPVDWNSRQTVQTSKASQLPVEAIVPEPLPTLAVPIESLAGVYHNAGYGAVELCAFPVTNSTTLSPPCKELAENIDVVLPGAINRNKPTLVGHWKKVWSTHVILEHSCDNLFNLFAPTSMPTNDPSYPFWTYGRDRSQVGMPALLAEFSLAPDQGFGLKGGVWGAGSDAEPPTGDTVQDRAEVYFEKL